MQANPILPLEEHLPAFPAALLQGEDIMTTRPAPRLNSALFAMVATVGLCALPATAEPLPGDVNNDMVVDAIDIDLVFAAVGGGAPAYDLNGDTVVDTGDVGTLLHDMLATEYADFNLDRKVDLSDQSILSANYGESGTGWATGDATGDGKTDAADLSILRTNWGFGNSRARAVASPVLRPVPEPGALACLAGGIPILLLRRKG